MRTFELNPGVSVGGLGDLVAEVLDVLLDVGVIEATADESFGRIEGVLRISDGLTLGWGADEPLAVISEGDDGRRGSHTLSIFNNLRCAS